MTMPTEEQRERAEKLGRLAARESAAVTSCPFPVDGAPADRVLAARFIAGYVAAGGTVDGIGDEDQEDAPEALPNTGWRPKRIPTAYEHLGY